MELASYDELLQQVECLKAENSSLRKELAFNSKHLNQLGNEASNMKEVITNLQDSNSDCTTSTPINSSISYNTPDNRNDNEITDCANSNGISENKNSQLEQLERERARILKDIEAEEREKQWFISCLDRINQQLMQLSQSKGFMSSNERMVWQQLQQDAGHLQETMQQKLGSKGEIERRQEARVHSIFFIEKQMNHLCQNQSQGNPLQEDDFSKQGNAEDGCCGRMTTSGTQTVDLFSVMNTPPPAMDEDHNITSVYNGSWLMDRVLWHSSPSSVGGSIHSFNHDEVGSYKSGAANYRNRNQTPQQFGTKLEMVYSLLSMLRSQNKEDMSEKLLNMSASVDSCIAMRQSGCLPLLIELLHGSEENKTELGRPSREIRRRAAQALHNIIRSHPDDKRGRRETRVLKLLEQVREYCNIIRDSDSGSDEETNCPEAASTDHYPVSAVAMLMKLSFDEEHRHTMCQLGGLQALAELIQLDYETHGNVNAPDSITMRRYAGMALTNLTFGDGTNKALLCSNRPFMRALVAQLHSPSEDLRQVTASVLRNLSWRADQASKKALRDIGAVVVLMKASMEARKESTLKSILSALWNLSAHCSMNKADICAVDGALAFLVTTLTYRSPSKTHAIVENGGGILRNISSHIAVREDYRAILREHNCLGVLLQHLRSPSLTIVSNACGTLWNLSARCVEDQQALWDHGAVSMLRNLVHSKHKMISMGSSAALKNLLQAKPGGLAASADKALPGAVPSLLVRKQRALEEELDHNLAETCENLDSPKTSPTHHCSDRKTNRSERECKDNFRPALSTGPYQLHGRMYHSVGGHLPPGGKVSRSESKDSVLTTKSDSSHDRLKSLNMLLRHRQSHPVSENEEAVIEPLPMQVPQVLLESRIQYVMQEVTRQIAEESGETLGKRDARSLRFLKSNNTHSAEPETQNDNTLLDKYSSITTMIEKLDLCDGDNEQPVNYSLKYTEEIDVCGKDKSSEGGVEKVSQNDIYSHYAETDLDDPDQLTNYSLRYTEDTDTTDTFRPPGPKEEKEFFGREDYQGKSSMHDDTMRVYCTEDTPLNFSTATSMTDLREIRETKKIPAETEIDNKAQPNDSTVSYCVEGTPVCFSRVSSLSSLNSNPEAIGASPCKVLPIMPQEDKISLEDVPKTKPCIVSTSKPNILLQDGKTVRFDEEQLVEETPLMFSRCSSLGSLSSFDQHSIHDDRSSVISDFSRRASEVVSPSDLPDSPGETRPSTPPNAFVQPSAKNNDHVKSEIFDDSSRVYAIEGTPLQFSQATSLSSLPISPSHCVETKDDDIKVQNEEDNSVEERVSDGEEDNDGDELLAACINSAMPNNTRSNAASRSNIKLVSKINVLTTNNNGGSSRIRSSGIPIKCNNLRGPGRSCSSVPPVPVSSADVSRDNNSSRDSNSDSGSVFDDDNMLAQCIRSGMPRAVSSRTTAIDRKNLNDECVILDAKQSPSSFKSFAHSSREYEASSSSSAIAMKQLLDAVSSKSDGKYSLMNKNVETNETSKVDDKKTSKLECNKLGFKPWANGGDRVGMLKSKPNCSADERRRKVEHESDERYHQFQVEDTPVCFSANSSLSSLSVDSCGVESTASEQALLDECIHSGMPPHHVRSPPTQKNDSGQLLPKKCLPKTVAEKNEPATTKNLPSNNFGKLRDRRSEDVHFNGAACDAGVTDVSLIDNIKPPSLMEDMTDMTSSTYSVASLQSDVLESKSESINSDFVNLVLKPVTEMFVKDLMGGTPASGSASLSFYEALENVNPPSVLMEVTANTLYEVTEVATETVANGNDTDVEDDLPDDTRLPNGFKKLDSEEGYISPEDVQVLKENAELVVTTLNEIQTQASSADESLSEDMLLECETISLVSNESDSSFTNSESPMENLGANRGPKIVKPVNKNVVKKEEDKAVGIRGRRRVNHSRQQMIISSMTRFSSPKPKEMLVKPTKTSALRTTQSQQKVATSDLAKRGMGKGSNAASPQQKLRGIPSAKAQETGMQPKPPIKQATFTKDKPSLSQVPKISPTKTRIPTLGHTPIPTGRCTQQLREEKHTKLPTETGSRRGQSLSPVSRSLYSSRCTFGSRKLMSSAAGKSSPVCGILTQDGTDVERQSSKSSLHGKKKQMSSPPMRSSSNASLCSSTSSSTTSNSTKSTENKATGGLKTTSKLNNVWKGKPKNNCASISQLKRSSTYEKLDSQVLTPDGENKSCAGPTAAIVPPFNYTAPKVRQLRSQIPVTAAGGNAEQTSDDENKHPCLITYV